jgi:hypothetical protein
MVKKIIGVVFMILALMCIGATVYEFIAAKGAMNIWSVDVLGAAAFHGVCMIIAVFLLAHPTVKKGEQTKEV